MASAVLNDRVTPLASLPKPPPGPLPIWGKVIWYLAETVAFSNIWQHFDYGDVMEPTQGGTADPLASVWTRWRFDWVDSSGDTADTQNQTIDVVNYTNGVIDSTWTPSDFDFVGDMMENFGVAVATYTVGNKTLTRIAAYLMGFNPYTEPKPFAASGSPAYSRAVSHLGALTGPMPPQVRSTVTEETPSRRHWGRSYLPTPGSGAFTSNGRLTNAYVDATVLAYSNLVQSLASQECQVVIPTTMSNKQPTRTLQNITGIHADSTSDVIRSGRYHQTLYKHSDPVGATQPADEPAP